MYLQAVEALFEGTLRVRQLHCTSLIKAMSARYRLASVTSQTTGAHTYAEGVFQEF
jgi:hypothetical protein